VAAFLPLLIKKAANESGQIKEGAQEIMTIMAENCGYPRTIEGKKSVMKLVRSCRAIRQPQWLRFPSNCWLRWSLGWEGV